MNVKSIFGMVSDFIGGVTGLLGGLVNTFLSGGVTGLIVLLVVLSFFDGK